jgi:hypothetical protein
VPTNPPLDLEFTTVSGERRTLGQWLTTFHLASVVVDPYTNESSWILETAARILRNFSESAVRVNWIVTADADDARAFLGPLADEFLTYVDPDRAIVRSLGLAALPAFVFLRIDGTVPAAAEGWDPAAWRHVADTISSTTAWSRAPIPLVTDPVAFAGSPALGL